MAPKEKFPYVQLIFSEDGERLVDASVHLTGKVASDRLVVEPAGRQTLQALFILMLLAKFRGVEFAEGKEERIRFLADGGRPSWIKTLGESFASGAGKGLLDEYFHECRFLSASRGDLHNRRGAQPPSATYYTKALDLSHLHFYKRTDGSKVADLSLSRAELVSLAETLENHYVKKGKWEPLVREIAEATDQRRLPEVDLPAGGKDLPSSVLPYEISTD